MTHVRQAYPAPTLGVSTLAPRNRGYGLASEQINMRSDPVNKLSRRPSLEWLQDLGAVRGEVHLHTYRKDGKDITVLITSSKGGVLAESIQRALGINPAGTLLKVREGFSNVRVWEGNEEKIVKGSIEGYIGNTVDIKTVEADGDVYILNTAKTVEMLDNTDVESITTWPTYINVLSALNYGETVKITLTDPQSQRRLEVVHTVPDLGITNPNYDAADKARATAQVATDIAAKINALSVPNADITLDVINAMLRRNATLDFESYSIITAATLRMTDAQVDQMVTELKDMYTVSNEAAVKAGINSCRNVMESAPTSHGHDYFWKVHATRVFNAVKAYVTVSTATAPQIVAKAKGSSVGVYSEHVARNNWVKLEVATGQGDRSLAVINTVREDVAGLPLYAMEGSVVHIKPSTLSETGSYYLKAQRVDDKSAPQPLEMVEVVWEETRSPNDKFAFNSATLPYILTRTDGEWKVQENDWSERKRGDDTSCPIPAFVGRTINDISYFQSRLVFVSDTDVHMTVTKQLNDWWKQSAVRLLETDPIEIASSAAGVDVIKHIIPHNRDMLFVSSNAQFKIAGDVAVTPKTVSLQLTTKYNVDVGASPVGVGNAVYLPFDYGTSAGLQEYYAEKSTNQDRAESITHHVASLLKGHIRLMTASPNIEIIAVQADGMAPNEIAIFEQYTSGGQVHQRAWSIWKLPEDSLVLDMQFRDTELHLITTDTTNMYRKVIKAYSVIDKDTVYLDDMITAQAIDSTVTLPLGYPTDNLVVVRGDGCKFKLNQSQYTVRKTRDAVIKLDEDIGNGTVHIGRPFRSSYTPTRPFYMEGDGVVSTSDRIRVNSFTLAAIETAEVRMSIKSDLYKFDDQIDTGRYMDNMNNRLGTVPITSRDIRFSYRQNADAAEAVFFTDSYLNMTIVGISWEGQFYQSARSM